MIQRFSLPAGTSIRPPGETPMRSGKDAGLSGAFGIGQSGSSFGGGSLVERNLDRWTVFFAVLFVVNTLVLLKI